MCGMFTENEIILQNSRSSMIEYFMLALIHLFLHYIFNLQSIQNDEKCYCEMRKIIRVIVCSQWEQYSNAMQCNAI